MSIMFVLGQTRPTMCCSSIAVIYRRLMQIPPISWPWWKTDGVGPGNTTMAGPKVRRRRAATNWTLSGGRESWQTWALDSAAH